MARRADPTDWTDVQQLDRLFWLGYVPRAAFDRAVAANPRAGGKAATASRTAELTASLTIGGRRRSWFGGSVSWVPFHKLDKAWWDTHMRGKQQV